MKEKLKKVGKYIKDHKKEIAIGTIVTVGSAFVGTEMLKIPGITEESTISAIIQNENL